MKSTAIIFGALALIAGGTAEFAQAATPERTVSQTVSTADLDLGTPTGQALLKRRIDHAAAEVCGESTAVDPASRRSVRRCRSDVADKARNEIAARLGQERLAAR